METERVDSLHHHDHMNKNRFFLRTEHYQSPKLPNLLVENRIWKLEGKQTLCV